MQIRDFLMPEGILIGYNAHDKKSVLDMLVELHDRCGDLKNAAAYYEQVLAREEEGTTAVGGATAIPHAQGGAVRRTGLCAMTLQEGVDWGAPDGGPVQLVFLIASPGQGSEHLSVLSRLITMLMNKSVACALIRAESPEAFLAILEEEEQARRMEPHKIPMPKPRDYPPDWTGVEPATPKEPAGYAFGSQDLYRILAVVSQPEEGTADNAYVYMATQALQSAAAQLGVEIKVETWESEGVENALTDREIQQAQAIVITADGPVDMARFDGKRVVRGTLGDGIRYAEKMLRRALSDTAPVYHQNVPWRKGGREKQSTEAKSRSLPSLSEYLQKGAASVLPFYAAGGLLKVIGFLIDLFVGAPYTDTFGYTSPAASLFYTLGAMLFTFALPVLSASIAQAMAGKWAVVPGFAGGWLAAIGATFEKVGGGISSGLFGSLLAGLAAGVLTLLLQKLFSSLPTVMSYFLYTLCGVILTGAAVCGINPLAAALYDGVYGLLETAGSINTILLGAMLGACAALDMGGPISRAAFAFAGIQGGTALASAAVAAITVPISVALAASVFRGRFPLPQRQNGPANYILGLGGILEGALPFAAASPLRIIPACLVGSAVAGSITAAFGCSTAASTGGLFVFASMDGWMYALLAVITGVIIGMFLLAALGKVHAPEDTAESVSSGRQKAPVQQESTS